VVYLIEKNNKVYAIGGEGSSTTSDNIILKQILSTFQFTK
jgi:hypothetical protein